MGLVNPTGSPIKSIQSGSTNINGNVTSRTTIISTVNLAKSVAMFGGSSTSATALDTGTATVRLTSPTQLTFARDSNASSSIVSISWTVIEYV